MPPPPSDPKNVQIRLVRDDDVDYLYFCDKLSCDQFRSGLADAAARGLDVPNWRVFNIETWKTLATDCAPRDYHCWSRDLKLRPHRFPRFQKYARSIYIDANVAVKSFPKELLDTVRPGDDASDKADFAAFVFDRSAVDEGKYVKKYLVRRFHLRRPEHVAGLGAKLQVQMERYKHLNRTIYGKVLVRSHNMRTCLFNELWWREFTRGLPRDQLSLLWATERAGQLGGFRFTPLNRGKGKRLCWCAADDLGFQPYFVHLGKKEEKRAPHR